MLGCHDFCGYYEWTFHYLRRNFGQAAVQKLWSEAIAIDSQRHYIAAGAGRGLRGLYETWSKTGEDEQCDWTVDLDEERNVLHVNMHNCPSKGFLILNNRNADEDYCDHCIGWITPALAVIDTEVSAHEHNHCGQCWWEFRKVDQAQPEVENLEDIRNFEDWRHGYLDTFVHGVKQPVTTTSHDIDPVEFFLNHFQGSDPDILTCEQYLAKPPGQANSTVLLLSEDESHLRDVAERFGSLSPEQRPLAVFPYFPGREEVAFSAYGLARPFPVLPLLIRAGVYAHKPDQSAPTDEVTASLIREALKKLLSESKAQ